MRYLTVAVLAIVAVGCQSIPPDRTDRMQNAGGLSDESVNQANYVMNRAFQDNLMRSYAESSTEGANELQAGLARDQAAHNASEAAIRRHQSEINAMQAGDDVRAGRRTQTEVSEQTLLMLQSLNANQTRILEELKAR